MCAFLQLRSKTFQRAELQLFDCSFTAPELFSDLANTFLLDEARVNHSVLRFGEPVDELKHHRGPLDFGGHDFDRFVLTRHFAPGSREVIGEDAGCDAEQPGDKRYALPLELVNPGESLAKYFRGQIFGCRAIAGAASDVCVNPVEIVFIQIGKARGILARGFDPFLLLLKIRHLYS